MTYSVKINGIRRGEIRRLRIGQYQYVSDNPDCTPRATFSTLDQAHMNLLKGILI